METEETIEDPVIDGAEEAEKGAEEEE